MLGYIWTFTRLCYQAQIELWEREKEALDAGNDNISQTLRDAQITLYSSAIQLNAAETAIRRSPAPNPDLLRLLEATEASATIAIDELGRLGTAVQGAQRLIDALEGLRASSARHFGGKAVS